MTGVFLCSCNGRISRILNLREIAEEIRKIEGVKFVKIHDKLCLEEGKEELKKCTEEKIVIAACSPQICENIFRKYTNAKIEIANIREHCAYPHRDNKKHANEKAKSLIKACVEKIKKSGKYSYSYVKFKPKESILIIGNTEEGRAAASKIESLGYSAHIIDSSEIENVSGSIGDFKVKISGNKQKTLEVGAIIVATGFEEWKPYEIKHYGYGRYENVITQSELAEILYNHDRSKTKPDLNKIKKVVIILCVGSRDNYHEYCSKICCSYAIKHAIEIKKRKPDAEIFILYMDIRTYGKYEKYYKKARELGIKFLRGKPSSIIRHDKNRSIIIVEDALTQEILKIDAELVVLTPALIPAKGTKRLAKLLGIELNKHGFFKKLYPKLRVVETSRAGIFVCGSSSGIKDEEERIAEGEAAALKAIKTLKSLENEKKAFARANSEKCVGCEICYKVCPHGAITIKNEKAEIRSSECKGCGICYAFCLYDAIELSDYGREEIFAYLEGLLKDTKIKKPIVNFVCYECGYAAIDLAGMQGYTYPANVLHVPLPCVGRISVVEILKAFELGANKVLITGCGEGGCHYLKGNEYAEMHLKLAQNILEEIGMKRENVDSIYLFGYEAKKYVEKVRRFADV